MRTLLMVDVQNDFITGSLAVPNAKEIIPYINSIADNYDYVIATMDWHPANHKSFAYNHTGKKPGDIINLNGIQQMLWPDHCVQNTLGAAPGTGLKIKVDKYVNKGENAYYDSYSGFTDAGGNATGLHQILTDMGITHFDVVGLATDFCVKATVLDGIALGYGIDILNKGIRAVNINPDDGEKAITEMENAGAFIFSGYRHNSRFSQRTLA